MSDSTATPGATAGVDPSRYPRIVTAMPRWQMNDAQRAEADAAHAAEIEAAAKHLPPSVANELRGGINSTAPEAGRDRSTE